jgi:hypothetical protein
MMEWEGEILIQFTSQPINTAAGGWDQHVNEEGPHWLIENETMRFVGIVNEKKCRLVDTGRLLVS